MASVNSVPSAASVVAGHPAATVNHAGGLAFAMDAKTRLYTRVATSFRGEGKYYQDGQSHDEEIRKDIREVAKADPEFVLRLAAYVRQELHLRAVPVLMLVEASRIPACKPYVRQWTPAIITRADEPCEVVASWIAQSGQVGDRGPRGGEHAFPNSLKKGLADAFCQNFDEYQLAKYDRERAVRLRDAIRIAAPKPVSDAQSALFRYLTRGELREDLLPVLAAKAKLLRKKELDAEALELAADSYATWEVLTSHFGGGREAWEAAIPAMGYMAKLRNVRNFLQKGVDMEPVLRHLANPKAVKHSKQLPFRFFSAYREIERCGEPEAGRVLAALSEALEASVVNLPRFGGKTFITMDNSGSMGTPLSQHSSVCYADVANLLGAVAHSLCDQAITSVFGESHAEVVVNPKDSIMTNMKRFSGTNVGHSTNAYLSVRWLRKQGHRVDRIILLSDCQCYVSSGRHCSLSEELLEYRSSVNPDVSVHSVDLAGYGTSQFPQDWPRLGLWAGWSEKTLGAMAMFEEDKAAAIARIAAWTPPARKRQADESGEEPNEA